MGPPPSGISHHMNEGYYVLVKYTAEPQFAAELDRVFNITDGILRSMTTTV